MAPTLLSLPTELLQEIASYLHTNGDICSVIKTCRRLHNVSVAKLYRRVELGYFGPTNGHEKQRSPEHTLRVLKALANPNHARHVVFLDHVDSPLPDFTRASSKRPFNDDEAETIPMPLPIIVPAPAPTIAVPAHGVPEAPPLPPPPPPPQSERLKYHREDLEEALRVAMENLDEAQIHTLRIVQGSDSLVNAMLQYVVRHNRVRRLWLEDVPLRCLTHFLEVTPQVHDPEFKTGLTHLRLRKLKEMGSSRALFRGHYIPDDNCIHRFLEFMLPCSPHLTSLALDATQNLENLPTLLENLTLPALTAFQLRSQTEDGCIAPYYLTNPRILNFLLRHPKLEAFGWPAEHFTPDAQGAATLMPLISQFSGQLQWFRADCSLLDYLTHDRQIRHRGSPKISRLFLATFLRRMECLETIKLQGDYQSDELVAIHDAIAASPSSRKITKYSLIRKYVEADLMPGLVAAMPNLQILKLCAYFTPGLISFYDIAPQSVVQGNQAPQDTNIALDHFLSYLTPLKQLTTLTFPLHPGLDIADRVVSDIWDSYREQHPPSPNFHTHPHFKPMAAEIDMLSPLPATTTTIDNGIEQHVIPDPDVAAVHPPAVVKHLLRNLRRVARVSGTQGGCFENLKTVRCFFILSMNNAALDITELLVDVEHRRPETSGGLVEKVEKMGLEKEEEEAKDRGRLELRGSPVIAYGWGTGLWLGETKDLASRAWF